MVIHLATDHAGLAHKEVVKDWLAKEGYQVVDHGAYEFNPLDDFTDTIALAAAAVKANPEQARGIIFGGSGQGEAMLANRYANVRAAVYYAPDLEIIELAREHNNSNVLSIGARFVSESETLAAVALWLSTPTSTEEKYARRNLKLEAITKSMRTV